MITRLNKSDELNFIDFCKRRDRCNDFYVMKKRNKIYLDDVKTSRYFFRHILKNENLCYISKDSKGINGIILVDNNYIKILSHELKIAEGLLRVLLWNHKKKFNIRIQKKNPLKSIIKKFKFRFSKSLKTSMIFYHIPRERNNK